MEYFDKYAVLRSHWKCVVLHCFSWNGSGLICGVLGLQWNYCVFTIDTILSWNIGPRRILVFRSHFRRTGKGSITQMNCCEISVFLKTWKKHYMEITHFWPADPILWCMGKTPALERVAVKWVFPTIFHWIYLGKYVEFSSAFNLECGPLRSFIVQDLNKLLRNK